MLSAAPVRLRIPQEPAAALTAHGLQAGQLLPVLSHSAPTVLDERWWQQDAQRGARLQMVLGAPEAPARGNDGPGRFGPGGPGPRLLAGNPADGGTAVLAISERGHWMLEGLYD